MSAVPYVELYYNQVRAKASHNSYQRSEGLSDQFAYWRPCSLELDLHNSNKSGRLASASRGLVCYYTSSDHDSSVRTFSAGLQLLAGFHAAVPDHEVCTIALDIKDGFHSTHTPDQLDKLINFALPGCVFTPAQLLGSNISLQQSANAWPKLSTLRGKFVFILTTGNLDSPDSHLNQFVENGETANIRSGFVAPEISSVAQITARITRSGSIWKLPTLPPWAARFFQDRFMSRAFSADSRSARTVRLIGKMASANRFISFPPTRSTAW